MRLVWKIVATLVVGTALGLGVTWLLVFRIAPHRVSDGPWNTNLAAGSAQADPDTRAFIAIHGLFALSRREAVYYTAATDSDGRRLDGNCRYAIGGQEPDARWWSITAYGPDGTLIANPANRYSVSSQTIQADAKGDFTVSVGTTADGSNAIPVRAGPFSLTLRLYQPALAFVVDPAQAELPVVQRIACP
ncbi:MAG TPA: DUF1214 domain-containing protein [Acetobacteraceae bacterium]|jgi:hypothetical protein